MHAQQRKQPHPIAKEAKQKEQQHYHALEAHKALCVAVQALARLQVSRVERLLRSFALHRVVDLEGLLGACGAVTAEWKGQAQNYAPRSTLSHSSARQCWRCTLTRHPR